MCTPASQPCLSVHCQFIRRLQLLEPKRIEEDFPPTANGLGSSEMGSAPVHIFTGQLMKTHAQGGMRVSISEIVPRTTSPTRSVVSHPYIDLER